jgi:rhodanese-related sulfurtransferase
MAAMIDAPRLKSMLSDGGEIALIDVREAGQFGEGHLFFAVPLAYSRFELGLGALVPNPNVRLVLCDNGDGVAQRAAARAERLGYGNVLLLAGGVDAWQAAGYTLYAGVNVPSKTFGELVELQRHTPRLSAAELAALRQGNANCVIVDGRPFSEYRKMNIPGGICCPNGELALHIHDIAPDPNTTIIVNCAGRTRSIIGAQLLIDFGVPNPVYALENGTQGWFLAGFELERGADRRHGGPPTSNLARLRQRARAQAEQRGVEFVSGATAQRWLREPERTTYLLDVRSPEEVAGDALAGFTSAPGGQLIQATDQWVGVKGARLLLLDAEGVRAPVIAGWLRQMGHAASVIEGGTSAARAHDWRPQGAAVSPFTAELGTVSAREAAAALARGGLELIDLRPSLSYRQGHLAGAVWSIRPRLAAACPPRGSSVVLVAEEPAIARLAAIDLMEAGAHEVRILSDGPEAWSEAGLPMLATPGDPADQARIDFLFFTAKRHEGTEEAAAAARQYLAWEIGLIDQLDAQERGAFAIR